MVEKIWVKSHFGGLMIKFSWILMNLMINSNKYRHFDCQYSISINVTTKSDDVVI